VKPIAILALIAAAGAGCAPLPAPSEAVKPPACQSATVPLTVGGRPEQATIEACPQPDGSWRITQTTPGLPPQVYAMPAAPPEAYPAAYPEDDYYFDYWPYWAGPWFWGIAPTIVVVQRFRHFEHFHHFHHLAPGGRPPPHSFGHAVAVAPAPGGVHR
jgi:hypothetical protein